MSKIYQKNIPTAKNPAKSKFGGFTLIELLVVVLIIGVLAAIALPKYEVAVLKSRAVQALLSVRSLADAQTRYYMQNGHYTTDLSLLDIEIPSSQDFTVSYGEDCSTGNAGVHAIYRKGTLLFIYHPAPYPCSKNQGLAGVMECRALASSKAAQQTCLSMGGEKKYDGEWIIYYF